MFINMFSDINISTCYSIMDFSEVFFLNAALLIYLLPSNNTLNSLSSCNTLNTLSSLPPFLSQVQHFISLPPQRLPPLPHQTLPSPASSTAPPDPLNALHFLPSQRAHSPRQVIPATPRASAMNLSERRGSASSGASTSQLARQLPPGVRNRKTSAVSNWQ